MIDYIIYLSILFIGILIGIYRWRAMDMSLHSIVLYLILTCGVESTAYYLMNYLKISPLFLYHFYSPIYFSTIAWYFHQVIKQPVVKKGVIYITLFFICFSIYTSSIQSLKEINSAATSVESVFIILLSCFTIYELFERMDSVRLTDEHSFWVSLGFALFNIGTFIYFSLQAYLFRETPEIGKLLFVLVKLLNFVLYPLLIIALICPIKLSKFTRLS